MVSYRSAGITRLHALFVVCLLLSFAGCGEKGPSFFEPLAQGAPADQFPTLAQLDGLTMNHDFVLGSTDCPPGLPAAYSAQASYTVSGDVLSIVFANAPDALVGSYNPATGALTAQGGLVDLGPDQQAQETWNGTATITAGQIGTSFSSLTNFVGAVNCGATYAGTGQQVP